MAGRCGAAVQRRVRIEPFDPMTADAATAAAYADVVAASRLGNTPRGLRQPPAYVLNRLRNSSVDRRTFCWVAYDGPTMVGTTELTWWESPDNRDRAWLFLDAFDDDVLDALAAAAAERALPAGRTVCELDMHADSPVAAWLAAKGAVRGAVDEQNVLRLADVARDALVAEVAAAPTGYELVRFDGPVPEDLVTAFVEMNDAMNDAPRDDLTMEDWSYSVDRLREWEKALAARGHGRWTVVARHVETGALAGFNQLVLRPEWPECVENEETAVVVAHRGHGLGRWVKAANILRVLDELPEAVCIQTHNAVSNTHMVRVNRALGFVPERVVESWELPTAAAVRGA